MNSKKKKLKIKKRRSLSRQELFKNKLIKEDNYLYWMWRAILKDFPGKKERQGYIEALIEGLETEPNLEIVG